MKKFTPSVGTEAKLIEVFYSVILTKELASGKKYNFLKRVEVAETMLGAQFPFIWQSKKHDNLSPSQPDISYQISAFLKEGAQPVPNCPKPRAS